MRISLFNIITFSPSKLKVGSFFLLVGWFFFVSLSLSSQSQAAKPKDIQYSFQGETACVQYFDASSFVHNKNGDKPMVPASVLKLITAEAVLQTLGPQYRFNTEIFTDRAHWRVSPKDGSSLLMVRNLYLKGYGDPFLVSEEWVKVVQALPEMRVQGDVFVDGSYFSPKLGIIQEEGILSPYNALNGAFATNFNTIAFTVRRGRIIPESQTPMTDYTKFRLINSWRHRGRNLIVDLQERRDHLLIKVIGPVKRMHRSFRIHLGFHRKNGMHYAGHLFRKFWNDKRAHKIGGNIRIRRTPLNAELIYRHRSSKTVKDNVMSLMEFSNNFLANQLVLVLGAKQYGKPATLAKGLKALKDIVLFRKVAGVLIKEGSGLDPENRISACNMVRFLVNSHHAGSILPQLLQRHENVAYKTGTFEDDGVRTLAGFLMKDDHTPIGAFAYFCNGKQCNSQHHDTYKEAANGWVR